MKSLSKQLLDNIREISESSDNVYAYLQEKIPNNPKIDSVDKDVTFSKAYDILCSGGGLKTIFSDYKEGKDFDEIIDNIVKGMAKSQGITTSKLLSNTRKAWKEREKRERWKQEDIDRKKRNDELKQKQERNKEIAKNGGFVYSKGDTIPCENNKGKTINIISDCKDIPQDKEFLSYARKYAKNMHELDYAVSYAYRESKKRSEPMIVHTSNYNMVFYWKVATLDEFDLRGCNNMHLEGFLVTPSGKFYKVDGGWKF